MPILIENVQKDLGNWNWDNWNFPLTLELNFVSLDQNVSQWLEFLFMQLITHVIPLAPVAVWSEKTLILK